MDESAQRQHYPPLTRPDFGSTAAGANAHLYPPNPITHHHEYSEYDTDRDSVLTVVASNQSGKDSSHKSRDSYSLPSGDDLEGSRLVGRTPSPTPSELRELKSGAIDWQGMRSWKFWIRREWLWYYVLAVVLVTITVLVSVFHKQIVDGLTPAANWLHDTPGGWVVPIAILFVISFPPLFGHEIVAILCGLVWGFWAGFGIVAAGTLLGEIGNFYAFKYCCRSRGSKLERTSIPYACLAKVVRDGGFKIALIARLSAIPGHFTTAIFSTCGMGIIVFTIAAILSMPKQILGVYLGVLLEQSATGTTDSKGRIVSDIVLALTFIITIAAMWYILRQMNKVKPEIIYKRRKARQAKFSRAGLGHLSTPSEVTIVFDPTSLESGKGLDNDDDHHIKAPQPIRPLSISRQPLNARPSLGEDYSEPGPYSSRDMTREGSTDEVGWDMGAPHRSDNPYHLGSGPPGMSSSDHLDDRTGRRWA